MKFVFFLIITLTLATTLSHEYLRLAPLLAVFYTIAFFILKTFEYGDDFFISFNARKDLKPTPKILLAGQEISTDEQADSQEDRFLSFFDIGRVMKRRILGALIPICGYIFLYRQQQLAPGLNTIIPLISCYFIINALYVGHFYVILALNLLLAISNINAETSSIALAAYGLSFVLVLSLLSQKGNWIKKKALSLIILGGLSLISCWGLHQLINRPEDKIKKNKFSQVQQQQLQQFINQQQMMSTSVEGAIAKLKGMPHMEGNISTLSQQMELRQSQIQTLKQLSSRPQLTSQQQDQAEQLALSLMDNQTEIEAALNDLSAKAQDSKSTADDDLEKLSSILSQQEGPVEEGLAEGGQGLGKQAERELTPDERLQVEKMLKSKEDLMPQLAEKMQSMNQKFQSGAPIKATEAKELLDSVLKQDQKVAQDKIAEALASAQIIQKPDLTKQPAKETDWMRRLKPLLILAGIFLVLRFILKKKGVKTVNTADPVILEELVRKWKEMRKRKLTPREEVIHYYHLFHESLQKIHYQKAEAPPSCIVAINMEEFNPELTKATKAVTEIFAQCFYGNKEVTSEALQLFRKGLKRILTVYQLG